MLDSGANLATYLVFDYERPSPSTNERSSNGNPFEELKEEEPFRLSGSSQTQTLGTDKPSEI